MTTTTTTFTPPLVDPTTSKTSAWRSAGAIFSGFLTVVVLSLGTDQLLHVLDVYPPWGQAMFENSLNLLALSYRILYTILGGYVCAKLAAPRSMRAVWILAGIGLFFGTLGAISTIPLNLGPAWYPILLAATAVPCTWLGGYWHRSSQSSR